MWLWFLMKGDIDNLVERHPPVRILKSARRKDLGLCNVF